jgi:hypothetical protein
LPASAGKAKAGAFAPSDNGKPAADWRCFLAAGFSAAGLAAVVFFAGAFSAGFFDALALNAFDAAACDAAGFFGDLPADAFAAARPAPATDFRADVVAAILEGVLGDFFRVFLDIRLPFVVFDGSIMISLPALRSAGQIRRPRSMVTTDSTPRAVPSLLKMLHGAG